MSALFHPKVLLLEGLLLIGCFAAQKALAQQPITPVKAPAEQTAKSEYGKLTAREKLELLVGFMVVGVERFGGAKALELLTPEFKAAFGVNADVSAVINRIVARNLEQGISDIPTITNEVETKVKTKLTPTDSKENKNTPEPSPSIAAAQL